MNRLVPVLVLASLFLLLLVASQMVFTVRQTQVAIVLELGKPKGESRAPGLHFKMPWQNVVRYDARILDYDAKPREVVTSDQKYLVVDNYAKWRIDNPLRFYQSLGDTNRALQRLDEIIYSQMREALGRHALTEVVTTKRGAIMREVTDNSARILSEYGIQLLDVRVRRTDLPPQNARSIYDRMTTERQRQAKQYRSEGQEEAAKIRSEAERNRTVLLAEAQREAEALRGQGEADAARIYAASFGAAPEFYATSRALEAYANGLSSGSRLLLTPGSGLLRHLR